MQANWSLILNVLLLVSVIVAIGRLMNSRRQSMGLERFRPSAVRTENSPYDAQPYHDDIIAVRKVNSEPSLGTDLGVEEEQVTLSHSAGKSSSPQLMAQEKPCRQSTLSAKNTPQLTSQKATVKSAATVKATAPSTIMFFLLAKENRQFAGYELLQTVLSAGLRFGDGQLFHRHQQANGQGAVLCSLATATASGTFDLQNIGAFSVRGLCLFMTVAHHPEIDAERLTIMLETARQLADGLDAHLLDDQRKPLTKPRIAQYYQTLGVGQEYMDCAMA